MIVLQIITLAFAVAVAWLNKWPVQLMRAYWSQGSHVPQAKEFHAANGAVKVLWAATIAYLIHSALFGLLLLFIEWFCFDITLNLFTGQPWDYLGKTAWLDRAIKNGKVKAVVALLIIVGLNFFIK